MEHVIVSLATTVGAFCGINICHITLAAEWQGIHNVYHSVTEQSRNAYYTVMTNVSK